MPDLQDCYTSPHASHTDGLFHEVRDEDFAAGRAAGVYQALCGAQVVVVDAFGPPCQACLRFLSRARRAAADAHSASHTPIPQQRRSRLRVLLGASS